LVVEPSNGTADKADHRWRLLVCQHLDVDQPRGDINRCMDLVLTEAIGESLLLITGDPVAHLPEP
jgi:hypothetical protein